MLGGTCGRTSCVACKSLQCKCGIILLPGTAPVVGRDYFYYTLASCLVPRGLHAAVCHITRNTSLALLCILDKSLLLVCNWYALWAVSHELLDT